MCVVHVCIRVADLHDVPSASCTIHFNITRRDMSSFGLGPPPLYTLDTLESGRRQTGEM